MERPETAEEVTMEFLVALELRIPDGSPELEVERRFRAEAAAAAGLADAGHLVRLWRPADGPETTTLGLYQASNEAELDELLGALPLADWLRTSVTPLAPHPNDPASTLPSGAVAWSSS